MSAAELTRLLMKLGTAADVVEALGDPELQHHKGWDLTGWTCDPVPWGVRFCRRGLAGEDPAEVLVLLDVYSKGRSRGAGPVRWSPRTTVLMIGA